jgi:hypothetical protein
MPWREVVAGDQPRRTASTGLASGSTASARPDELECDTFTTGPLAVTVIPTQSSESLVSRLFRDKPGRAEMTSPD